MKKAILFAAALFVAAIREAMNRNPEIIFN